MARSQLTFPHPGPDKTQCQGNPHRTPPTFISKKIPSRIELGWEDFWDYSESLLYCTSETFPLMKITFMSL